MPAPKANLQCAEKPFPHPILLPSGQRAISGEWTQMAVRITRLGSSGRAAPAIPKMQNWADSDPLPGEYSPTNIARIRHGAWDRPVVSGHRTDSAGRVTATAG